jgi:transmembrane sensor
VKRAKLELPIKQHLEVVVEEDDVQRMHRAIEARGARDGRRWIAGAAAFASACVIAAIVWLQEPALREGVRLIDGRAPSVLEVPASAAKASPFDFDDGSRLVLDPGARLETLDNRGVQVVLLVEHGRIELELQPTPYRWIVECGLATIEVIGATLEVDRSERGVRVRVEEGEVLIRSVRVRDGIRKLRRGESVAIALEIVDAPASEAENEIPPKKIEQISAEPKNAEPKNAARKNVEQKNVARDPVEAPKLPELEKPELTAREPEAPKPPTIDEILRKADDARKRGDLEGAVAILERVLESGSHDSNAALAAYTLGRIELFDLRRAQRARTAFERSLASALPAALREDALAHLATAQDRAGDRQSARATADRYFTDYPNGRYLQKLAPLRR